MRFDDGAFVQSDSQLSSPQLAPLLRDFIFPGLPLLARFGILPDEMLDEINLVPPRMHNLMYAYMFALLAGCSLLKPEDQFDFLEGYRRNEKDVGQGNLSLAIRRAAFLGAFCVDCISRRE